MGFWSSIAKGLARAAVRSLTTPNRGKSRPNGGYKPSKPRPVNKGANVHKWINDKKAKGDWLPREEYEQRKREQHRNNRKPK